MKSILEILAVGATLAALATAAEAAAPASDAKVNVGTAAPIAISAPLCAQQPTALGAHVKATADAKPACVAPATANPNPAAPPPAH